MLYQMTKGDITQYETLKGMWEEEFYHVIQNHEKRAEFEAKYPRMGIF
ncbi:hypothetical protein [Christiangramia fulva]|nr:hypothetical protein [Christiangramia fulva]